jgi:outer membrane protein OmpU
MDSGVEFGGRVQIEDKNGPGDINGDLKIDDEAFWVSGVFGKVTLGETDGALDWAVPEIYSGSSLGDDHSTHAGAYWNTGLDARYDNQILRYEYSFGDFGVAISAEMDDTGVDDAVWGIGGNWAGKLGDFDVNAGLGFQSNGDQDTWALGGTAAMANGLSFAIGYADFSHSATNPAENFELENFLTGFNTGVGVEVESWVGVGVAYTTGALTVGANYGQYSAANSGDEDPEGWGVVANYDLGGGAVAMAGYGYSSGQNAAGQKYGSGNGNGVKTWSIGLGMSF